MLQDTWRKPRNSLWGRPCTVPALALLTAAALLLTGLWRPAYSMVHLLGMSASADLLSRAPIDGSRFPTPMHTAQLSTRHSSGGLLSTGALASPSGESFLSFSVCGDWATQRVALLSGKAAVRWLDQPARSCRVEGASQSKLSCRLAAARPAVGTCHLSWQPCACMPMQLYSLPCGRSGAGSGAEPHISPAAAPDGRSERGIRVGAAGQPGPVVLQSARPPYSNHCPEQYNCSPWLAQLLNSSQVSASLRMAGRCSILIDSLPACMPMAWRLRRGHQRQPAGRQCT